MEGQGEKMVVYHGRPTDESGRTDAELRLYDLLDKLNIDFLRMDHDAAMTMEDCKAIDVAFDICGCKNLFLRNTQRTEFYLLLMPGDKKFKTKDLSHQLGIARLSFGEEEYMVKYLGVHPGSVTVMGLMNDSERKVHLIIDRDIYHDEYVGCHPCANTSSIKMKTADLFEKFLPFTGHEPVYVTL